MGTPFGGPTASPVEVVKAIWPPRGRVDRKRRAVCRLVLFLESGQAQHAVVSEVVFACSRPVLAEGSGDLGDAQHVTHWYFHLIPVDYFCVFLHQTVRGRIGQRQVQVAELPAVPKPLEQVPSPSPLPREDRLGGPQVARLRMRAADAVPAVRARHPFPGYAVVHPARKVRLKAFQQLGLEPKCKAGLSRWACARTVNVVARLGKTRVQLGLQGLPLAHRQRREVVVSVAIFVVIVVVAAVAVGQLELRTGREEVLECCGAAHGNHLVLGVDEVAQHGHRSHLPEAALVLGAVSRKVPECATGVAHHGQAGRLELLQQDLEAVVVAQGLAMLLLQRNVARHVAENSAAVLDDGQGLGLAPVGERAHEECQCTLDVADDSYLVGCTMCREIPECRKDALERCLFVGFHGRPHEQGHCAHFSERLPT
ncbi:unnamed protein product [Ixodes pacificus]